MDKTKLSFIYAAFVALCACMRADPDSVAVRAASPSDLSSLARPQTFTYELRNMYLTQNIDSMSAGETTRVLVGDGFQTQKRSSTQKKGVLNVGQKGLSLSVSSKGSFSASSEHSHTEDQRLKKEQMSSEDISLGKCHLHFSVVLRNHAPDDTLVIQGGDMRVYLSGPGLPGEISVPYTEREEIHLGYGETLCKFDYEIRDKKQFEALLRLGNQGGFQLLELKVSGADFPVFSGKTGKNVLDEQAAWERNHPSTLVAIGFGDLASLSPWRVSRRHTKETGSVGTPVTVREALLAVGGTAEKQSETLPERVFTFSDKGHLVNVVDRPLLDRDEDGNYRLFAILLTKGKGKSEPHLPLAEVLNRNIKDYSELSLFEFTLDELAQNAVLLPSYFADVRGEVERWLEDAGEKEAIQCLKDALEEWERKDDDDDFPEDTLLITAEYVARCRRRAEAGVAKMQYKLARCLFGGYGVETNPVEAIRWCQKAAGQDELKAQVLLGECYFNGIGVASNHVEAVKWFLKAAEKGDAGAQFAVARSYLHGYGVARDGKKAVEWLGKAAKQGNAEAQTLLGDCYSIGVGVAQNHKEAANWYRKAAEQGNALAQLKLGTCYLNGEGVPRDFATALLWIQRSGLLVKPAVDAASPILRLLLKDR